MENSGILAIALGIAALAIATETGFAMTNPDATGDYNPPLPDQPNFWDTQSQTSSATDNGDQSMQNDINSRVVAVLSMIKQFESGGDYNILFGGNHFSDFSTHPFVVNGKCNLANAPVINVGAFRGQKSTAAGAYQINCKTFLDAAKGTGLYDFSPATQDAMAIWLLQKDGAYTFIESDNIPSAISIASKRWASLPGSTAGQNPQSMASAIAAYDGYLI